MTSDDILTAGERKRNKHDQTVHDILQIARQMMQADGVAALGFNAIARRLGIKPPSLYTYFGSKHEIYDTLFRRGFQFFAVYMEDRMDTDGDLEAFFRSSITAYMSFALDNPDLFQLMFQRPVPDFVPSDESMTVSLNTLHRMQSILQNKLTSSNVQPDEPIEQTTDLIISLTHGMTELQLANHPDSPVGEGRFGVLIDPAVQMLLQTYKPQT